MVIDISFT